MNRWFLVRWFGMAAAAAAMLAAGGSASAQSTFPSRPVHIFVPHAAGGGVDILARTLGDLVSRQWGQTVVVENRPGAGRDWLHPRVEGEMPDAGHLFELFQRWTPDLTVRHRILVTNPAKLYGFAELKV